MATSELGGRGGVVTLGSQPRPLGSVGRAAVDMWSLPTRAFSNFDWPRHDPLAQGADLYSLLGFESPFVQHALTPAEQVANDSAQLLESRLAKKLGEGKVYPHAFLPQGDRSYFTRVIDEYPKTFGEQTKGVVSPNTLHSLSIIRVVDPGLPQGDNLDTLTLWVQKQFPVGSSVKPDFTQLGQAHEEKGKRNHMIVVETPVDVEAGGKGKSVDMIVILPSATVEASEALVDAFLTEDVEKAKQRAKEAEQAVAAANGLKLVEEERRATAEANATTRDVREWYWVNSQKIPGIAYPRPLRGTRTKITYPTGEAVEHANFPGYFAETQTSDVEDRKWQRGSLNDQQAQAVQQSMEEHTRKRIIQEVIANPPTEPITVAVRGSKAGEPQDGFRFRELQPDGTRRGLVRPYQENVWVDSQTGDEYHLRSRGRMQVVHRDEEGRASVEDFRGNPRVVAQSRFGYIRGHQLTFNRPINNKLDTQSK